MASTMESGILSMIRCWQRAILRSDVGRQAANKEAVFREFGLDESRLDHPLLAMISRIDVQKGFDLVVAILDDLLSQDLTFVMLGAGNKETESQLATIVARHPGKAALEPWL